MYQIDWHCPHCFACYQTCAKFTICPSDGYNLELQFKAVGYRGTI